jgi:glycosyltransferase involved in cell wall biosynthesis
MDVSAIIPTYNAAPILRRMLETLVRQNLPHDLDWEALVIDNASSDNTPEVVGEFSDRCDAVRYVCEKRQGLGHARNRGIAESSGELLCFFDQDVLVSPDYLRNANRFWKGGEWDLAGGRVLPHYEVTPPRWISALPMKALEGPLSLYDRGDRDFVLGEEVERVAIGANMLIGRPAIGTLGGFKAADEAGNILRAGGDTDFFLRARREGLRIGYAGSCSVRHLVPKSRLTRRRFLNTAYLHAGTLPAETLPADTRF